MSNSHKPHLAVPTERGSIHRIWQLNGRVKWQCSRSKHQYFVCLVVHSIYQRIVLNLWFGRSRGYSKLWEFFRNLKVDSLLEYSTLGWAHKSWRSSLVKGLWVPGVPFRKLWPPRSKKKSWTYLNLSSFWMSESCRKRGYLVPNDEMV